MAFSDILDTARRLGATQLKRYGAEWVGPCPKCGGRDRFGVNAKKAIWHCRICGVGGDEIDLVRHVNACNYAEALRFLGRDDIQPPKRPPAKAKRPPVEPDRFAAEQIDRILRELVPLWRTDGVSYLCQTRGIETAEIADVLKRADAIGWLPSVYFHEPGHELHGQRLGCIVARMTDPVSGKYTGTSRTYLTADDRKIGKAKGWGPQGVVRLSEDADVLEGLGLAEGLETSLDVMARGFRPMWSTGGKALMAAFPIIAGIESLTLFADNDKDGGGLKAAQDAQARWLSAGREARVRMTPQPGDINDISGGDEP